ncbi:MAG: hypothetical protein ACOX75_08100 [Lachnospiraceae bacterium]|jgi:hypothetical protein
MDKPNGFQLQFFDEIIADTEEYTFMRDFRLNNIHDHTTLTSAHDDVYHLWAEDESRFGALGYEEYQS